MIRSIIITEGLDRCGKGTALANLEHDAIRNGYKVVTVFKQSETNSKENELSIKSYEPIKAAKSAFSNHIKYDLFSLGSLELVRKLLIQYQLAEDEYIVFIDRFALSNYVYGRLLRTEEFYDTFKNDDEVLDYCLASIKSLTIIAPVMLFIAVRPLNYKNYENDDANEHVKITANQLKLANEDFRNILLDSSFLTFEMGCKNLHTKLIEVHSEDHLDFYLKIRNYLLDVHKMLTM